MAYISSNNLWRSDFYKKVSAENRVQEINHNQLKLKVNDTHRKDEKITKVKAFNDEDVKKKEFLKTKFAGIKGHLSYIEKDLKKFKL